MSKTSGTSSARTNPKLSRKPALKTYRIRFTVCDGEFEYGQYTDMDSRIEPTEKEQVECVWQSWCSDDDEPKALPKAVWHEYRHTGRLEVESDDRIIDHIEIDEEATRHLAMVPLLKQQFTVMEQGTLYDEMLSMLKRSYAAMEDGSINDSGSDIPYAISSLIAKVERVV